MKNTVIAWKSVSLTIVCLMFLLLNTASASTNVSANTFIQKKTNSQTITETPNASYYTVDTMRLHNLLCNSTRIQIADFPLSDNITVTFDLKQGRSAFDRHTKCIVTSASGDIEMNAPELLVYRGIIANEPNSNVMLTYSAIGLLVSVHRENGNDYIFGQYRTSSDMRTYILLPEHELLATAPFVPFACMNDGIINQPNALTPVDQIFAEARSHKDRKFETQAVNTTGLLEAEIAIEADNDFYKAAGNTDTKVLSYIGALFSMSSSIYEDEAHITFRIPWVKVWATTDPYGVKGDAYALPDKAKNYWIANYSSVQRDLAHVMTSISYGGGGYGWYSLCDNNQSYSVSSPQTGHSYPTFAFTYDAYIVSHEIGHNFSLVHSHDCYWNPPLDTCHTKDDPNTALKLGDACFSLPIISKKNPGTIMSYCAGTNYTLSNNDFSQYKLEMTFSRRADTVLRANAEKASCITPPKDPTVILTYPRGSATYKGDSTVSILWTSAHITNVSIEYSDNGGTGWKSIKTNLPASDGATDWKIPNVASKKMLVRIFDASVSSIADTSLLFFTINSIAVGKIAVTKPTAGEQLDANTAQKIVFSASNTRSPLLLEFSSNGTTWTSIGTVINSADTIYNSWTTPDINSTTCSIRIKDGSDAGAIIGTSGVFSIKQNTSVRNIGGAPTTFFMTPNFPNPVKTTTTIKFEVPTHSLVTLKLYNELGQVVATLVNESLVPGVYQSVLDVKDLAAGNYNFTLVSGTTTLTSKMQVIK